MEILKIFKALMQKNFVLKLKITLKNEFEIKNSFFFIPYLEFLFWNSFCHSFHSFFEIPFFSVGIKPRNGSDWDPRIQTKQIPSDQTTAFYQQQSLIIRRELMARRWTILR